ncbi:MAG: archease [Candidatus Marsarchaeota archaeon]|nr:archease [Candidatus Marsarchaeota archaeon]MCL5106393.1 archease [Candidatus Marsarchaeota archaeon]
MHGKKYEYVDHTADIEFNAFGGSAEEAFKNSALALFDIISDIKKVKAEGARTYKIAIKEDADTLENLLWQFLQSCLSILDAKDRFGFDVHLIKIKNPNGGNSRYVLSALVLSKKRTGKHFKLEAKGISKYALAVSEKKSGKKSFFSTTAVVDI